MLLDIDFIWQACAVVLGFLLWFASESSRFMRVAVVYHMFPHYRLPVICMLERSSKNEYHFFGRDAAYDGILPIAASRFRRFERADFFVWCGIYWQSAALRIAVSSDFDGLILLGNPNFLSTWFAAVLGRITGKRVMYWTHGWLKPERGFKRLIRNVFYRLAHKVMVYGERAKFLGIASGFPVNSIEVIYNSLDVEVANRVVDEIECGLLQHTNPADFFSSPSRPLLICKGYPISSTTG